MDTNAMCDALAEWAQETVPAIESAYTHLPGSKPEALPDVIVELTRSYIQRGGGEQFPFWQLQEMHVEGYDCQLAIMVDNSDPDAAATALRGYRDLLAAAVRAQPTLAGRVPFRSPFVSFDFTPPFVEYEDGTTGREMTMSLTVGDLVEVEGG